MAASPRSFQVFAKPVGAGCNLACSYCYYLSKEDLGGPPRMSAEILEQYIRQHIEASADEMIRFSWHGGEPTLAGLDYFRLIVEIQRRNCPTGRTIANGIQTNGTLIDREWARFMAAEGFGVGLSLDGPRGIHDRHRTRRDGGSTCEQTIRGYELLRAHGVPVDILCVVGSHNASRPREVYGFFKRIGAANVSFLPLVERSSGKLTGVTPDSVTPETWGDFLCTVFDEWVAQDIGRIKVQIIEEAARTAFGQQHSLCLFRPTCGDIPVIERNGDVYSCDHFVDAGHLVGNIVRTPLVELLESPRQRAFGEAKVETLPGDCPACEVRDMCHGECPKNRFVAAPDGGPPLNYLCPGYKRFFTHVSPFVQEVAKQWRGSAGD